MNGKRLKINKNEFRLNVNRDPLIFIALQKMKLLRTQDLTRLYFGSSSRTNKRLRKLCREGYIKCKTQLPTSDYLYSLGPKGHEYLIEHCHSDYGVHTRENNTFNVDHLIALNSIRISLALAVGKKAGCDLVLFRPEWELKGEHDPTLLSVVPDAIFQLQHNVNGDLITFSYALEVDLGSETPAYLVKSKLSKYFAVKDSRMPFYGLSEFKILIVTTSLHRILKIAEPVCKEPASRDVLFSVLDFLDENTVLERIFLRAHSLSLKFRSDGVHGSPDVYESLLD